MSNCPFCNIDPIKTRIIYQGKGVYVVLSNPRLVPGHMLVIPSRHAEKLSDLTGAERQELFDTAIRVQEIVLQKFAKGCDLRQNYRPFMPQGWVKVDHAHIHVLPREFEDELYQRSMKFEKDMFKELPEDERERFTKLFSH